MKIDLSSKKCPAKFDLNVNTSDTGADLRFSEGWSYTQSWTSEAGVWGHSPPEAISCWVFEVPKSKV